MSVMFILIGCSLLLAIGFLAAFIWSVRSGQLDDDYTPSVRILFDDVERKTENGPSTIPIREAQAPFSICTDEEMSKRKNE
jgi:cbb3-type cytochrome oxidase maturation protein